MAEREYRSECKTCGKSGYLLLREQPATTFVRCPHCGSEALATALLPPPKPQTKGD